MQDRVQERAFYEELFEIKPENEHILEGYEELHELAFREPPGGGVLDLGCGTGAHAVRLARRGYHVIAVDLTIRGVRAARRRFLAEGMEGRFVVADAEQLPLRNGTVDVTWTSLLLHHFPKLDRLPRELGRVTRDRVIALEPNARNALTWFANNVINRFWGLSSMTPNQRALWPGGLRRVFHRHGFRQTALHYIDRAWADRLGWIRKTYRAMVFWLPDAFRANKFLVVYRKVRE